LSCSVEDKLFKQYLRYKEKDFEPIASLMMDAEDLRYVMINLAKQFVAYYTVRTKDELHTKHFYCMFPGPLRRTPPKVSATQQ